MDQIAPFWDVQLDRLRNLVEDSKMAQSKWNDCIPPEIRPGDGKFTTAALKHPMASRELGRSAWLGQLAFGFPIAGSLSHRHTFPLDGEFRDRIRPSRLVRKAANRFKELALKSGLGNA